MESIAHDRKFMIAASTYSVGVREPPHRAGILTIRATVSQPRIKRLENRFHLRIGKSVIRFLPKASGPKRSLYGQSLISSQYAPFRPPGREAPHPQFPEGSE